MVRQMEGEEFYRPIGFSVGRASGRSPPARFNSPTTPGLVSGEWQAEHVGQPAAGSVVGAEAEPKAAAEPATAAGSIGWSA